MTIKEYNRTGLLIDGLLAKEVDFIFASKLFFEYNYVKKPDAQVEFFGPEIQDTKWFGDGLSAYFHKENTQRKDAFNLAIKKLRASKEFQKLSQKYFSKDVFND